MNENEQQFTFDRVVRLVLAVSVVVALFALARHLSDVLVPFAIAVILAYLLNPVVTVIEEKVKRRWLAVAATLLGLGVIGVVLLLIVVPLMFGQLGRFEQSLGDLRTDLSGSVTTATTSQATAGATDSVPACGLAVLPAPTSRAASDEKSALGLSELLEGLDDYQRTKGEKSRQARLRQLLDNVDGTYAGVLMNHAIEFVRTQEFRALLFDAVKRLAVGGVTVINFTVELILGMTVLVVVLIYLVFLLLDFNEYARTWKSMLPPKYRDGILGFLGEFEEAMRRYFRGQFVVALSVGILFSIGFSIIGLPMAVPLGLFIGLLNMVPYLQIVAIVPAGLLALLRSIETSSSVLTSFMLVLIVFAVIQVLQDAVIVPRVMGKATGLRPVAILLGVFVWGKLLGFFGLVLAIPLTCLGIAYYRRYVLTNPRPPAPSSTASSIPK